MTAQVRESMPAAGAVEGWIPTFAGMRQEKAWDNDGPAIDAMLLQPAKWSIRFRKHNDGGHESSDKTGGADQVARPESGHGEAAGIGGDARHGVRVVGWADSNP